ncbi:MAG: hypothetical protein PVH11_06405 [Anaerolineae bacterium]
MLSSDLRASKAIMHTRLEEAQHKQELAKQLTEAGIDQRGWLARQSCRVLCQLGAQLVAFGESLERRYSLRQPLSAES